eukprot:scaffold154619_cov32-Tisochrysis_lutea.AAC.6
MVLTILLKPSIAITAITLLAVPVAYAFFSFMALQKMQQAILGSKEVRLERACIAPHRLQSPSSVYLSLAHRFPAVGQEHARHAQAVWTPHPGYYYGRSIRSHPHRHARGVVRARLCPFHQLARQSRLHRAGAWAAWRLRVGRGQGCARLPEEDRLKHLGHYWPIPCCR